MLRLCRHTSTLDSHPILKNAEQYLFLHFSGHCYIHSGLKSPAKWLHDERHLCGDFVWLSSLNSGLSYIPILQGSHNVISGFASHLFWPVWVMKFIWYLPLASHVWMSLYLLSCNSECELVQTGFSVRGSDSCKSAEATRCKSCRRVRAHIAAVVSTGWIVVLLKSSSELLNMQES